MNVRELINQLEKMPAGADVHIRVSFENSLYYEIGCLTWINFSEEHGPLGECMVDIPPREPPKKKKKARIAKKKRAAK